MPDRLAKTLVDAAMELHRRRLWEEVSPDSPILIRAAGHEAVVGILIGEADSGTGLKVLPGEAAFRWMIRMREHHLRPSFWDEWDVLSVTFHEFTNVPEALRSPLRAAGFTARPEQVAPFIVAKDLGRNMRPITRDEVRLLGACLTGILAADDSGELRAGILDDRKKTVLEVLVEGSKTETRRASWPTEEAVFPSILDLRGSFDGLSRVDERWVATIALIPGASEGDDRSVRAFVLVEEQSELVLTSEIVAGDDLHGAAERLALAFRGDNYLQKSGLPREILFASPFLHDSFAPALASIGVHSTLAAEPDFVSDLIHDLRAHLEEE